MNELNFNLDEVKEYSSDIECIKYLLKECKSRKIDSNLYYELVYFQQKFKQWLDSGIDDNLIRLTIEDLMNNLQIVINSVSEDELKTIYSLHNDSVPLKDYDKIRYKENDVNSNLGYVRQLYTDKVYDNMSKISDLLVSILLFIPLTFVFFVIVQCCVNCFLSSSLLLVLLEICEIIYLLYLYITNMALKADSLTSYNTGVYNLQKFDEYKYYYTNEESNFYLHDRVYRNELLAFYNIKYKNVYELLSSKNGLTYKERFDILVGLELDFISSLNSVESNLIL